MDNRKLYFNDDGQDNLQVIPMFPTQFQVNWPFVSGEEAKKGFLRLPPWWPSVISDGNDLSYFWSTSHLDASYQVSSRMAFWFRRRSEKYIIKMAAMAAILDFGSARFYLFLIYKSPRCFLPSFESIGLLVQEKISDQNYFSYFWSSSYRCFLLSHKSIGPSVQEKKRKLDFQDGRHSGHFGIRIGTTLGMFDLQDTPMLPTKFQVNWPLGSGEEAKNRFSRWLPRRPAWILDRNNFSYFWSTYHPDASYQVSSHMAFRFRRRSEK